MRTGRVDELHGRCARPLIFGTPSGGACRDVRLSGLSRLHRGLPKALRRAIAEDAPHLLPDFDAHWRRTIGDTYDLGPVPAFMARWWCEYAIARDPKLDAHVTELQHRAAEATDIAEAKALLDEVARIRYGARKLEPGE